MKKNDIFTGTCIDYTSEGLGVVKAEGFVFFIKDMLINEIALIKITKINKNIGFGFVDKYIRQSEERCNPKCKIAHLCGGCQLQHMEYDHQLDFKTNRVKTAFERIAKLEVSVNDCAGAVNPYNYRNKVQVPVKNGFDNKAVVGYYRSHTNDIVEYDTCYTQSDVENEIVKKMKIWINELNLTKIFRHILIKHSFNTNDVMVVFIVSVKDAKLKTLAEFVAKEFDNVKSVILNLNTRTDNVIMGDKEEILYGNKFITESLNDLVFNISSKSFYQINPVQTKYLYEKAIEFANLKSTDTLVDLYCGTGTIGLFAAKSVKKVIGIELINDAIKDAKVNAIKNNISNVEFICGDAAVISTKLIQRNEKIDVVVVDPPRKGLDIETIEAIKKMTPDRLVYVSCDVATCARDCAILSDMYKVEMIQPVDMFPQTTHVECVIQLTLAK